MPAASYRDRYFSAPPQTHNVSMGYGWSPNATGVGGITGIWQPIPLGSDGSLIVALNSGISIGSISVSGLTIDNTSVVNALTTGNAYLASISGASQGTYSPNFAIITGSQTTIPVNTKSYSIAVESGYAFINGNLFNAGSSIDGGSYNGSFRLSTAIAVGATGDVANPSRVIVYYES